MVLAIKKPGFKKVMFTFILALGIFLSLQPKANAEVLYEAVPVSDTGTGNSISQANTSRYLAVAPDGTIYSLFHGTSGIRIAKSTNRGASFSPSVLVRAGNYEAEVAVSSNGKVFVAWVESSKAYISISYDGANTFSAPIAVGTASSSVHMAVDADYVYLIDRIGVNFYYSSNGGKTFNQKTFSESYVFSDVHVNPLTGEVIIQKDNPSIIYYVSKDHGQSFGPRMTTSASVNYSVGAVSAGPMGTYLFVAGYNTMATRINLEDNTAKNLSFGVTNAAQGRSLNVDGFGNVVTGFVNGSNVYYAVSQDLGNTFGPAKRVATATMANAAANTTNGDVMFLYENGGRIYMSVFNNELKGYNLQVSTTNLNFANQDVGTQSDEKTVVVSNLSSTNIAIKEFNVSGEDFIINHDIGTVIKAGETYTISVKFAPKKAGDLSGVISILTDVSTEPRIIQLTGVGNDNIPPVTNITLEGTKGLNDIFISEVSIKFTATDGEIVGGVLKTEYSMDDGQKWKEFTNPVVVRDNGVHRILYRTVDNSGNVEEAKTYIFQIDTVSPTASIEYSETKLTNTNVIATLVPSEDITVTNNGGLDSYTFEENGEFTFEFMDRAGNKGTAVAKVENIDKKPPTATISYSSSEFTNKDVEAKLEADEEIIITNNNGESTYIFTENGVFTFRFKDLAGNIGEATAQVEVIDKTPPEITFNVYPEVNENGWYNKDVTISFTASDDLSGIDTVSPDQIIDTEGANQEVTGTAVDKAGNVGSYVVKNINIDKTAPVITVNAPLKGQYKTSDILKLDFDVDDVLSGIASTKATLDGKTVSTGQVIELTSLVGTHELKIIAVDKAGNAEEKTVTFEVIAAVDGQIIVTSASGNTKTDSDTLSPRFKIKNNGKEAIKLSDIKVRYYFTTDINSAAKFVCDWSTAGSANVVGSFVKLDNFRTQADAYMEIGFSSKAGSLAPGAEVEIHGRIMKADWSIMNQSNDYSFSNNTSYKVTPKTPGYIGGALQFGQEPGIETVDTVESAKIQAYNQKRDNKSDTIYVNVKLENTGNVDLNLEDLKVRYYFTKDEVKDHSFFVDYSSIEASKISGKFVSITPVKNGADTYVELSFSKGAGIISYGDSVSINFRILSKDGKQYVQTGDYSFEPNSSKYKDSTSITVLKGEDIIWGIEP